MFKVASSGVSSKVWSKNERQKQERRGMFLWVNYKWSINMQHLNGTEYLFRRVQSTLSTLFACFIGRGMVDNV